MMGTGRFEQDTFSMGGDKKETFLRETDQKMAGGEIQVSDFCVGSCAVHKLRG